MTDPVDATIMDIHEELCRSSVCSDVLIRAGKAEILTDRVEPSIHYTIGSVDRSGHKTLPSVSWIETGGKTDVPAPSADSDDDVDDGAEPLLTDVIRLRVLIQAANKEQCRLLFMNLRNAAKRVVPSQMSWGYSTAPTEEKHSQLCTLYAIEADVDLSLSVSKKPQQLPGFPVPLADYALRPVVSATDQTLEHME